MAKRYCPWCGGDVDPFRPRELKINNRSFLCPHCEKPVRESRLEHEMLHRIILFVIGVTLVYFDVNHYLNPRIPKYCAAACMIACIGTLFTPHYYVRAEAEAQENRRYHSTVRACKPLSYWKFFWLSRHQVILIGKMEEKSFTQRGFAVVNQIKGCKAALEMCFLPGVPPPQPGDAYSLKSGKTAFEIMIDRIEPAIASLEV